MSTADFAFTRRSTQGSGPQGLLARAVDVLLIVGGAAAAAQIRFEHVAHSRLDAAFVAFATAFTLALFPVFGIYQSWRGRSLLRLASQISLAWVVVQGCALVLMFSLHRTDFISRLWFAYWTGITGGGLIVSRLATHAVLRRVRHAGLNLRNVAVVGRGVHCHDVVSNIVASPASGFRAAAVFDVAPNVVPASNAAMPGVPTFDDLTQFIRHVREQGWQELWLALPLSEERTMLRLVNEFRDDLINIRFIPDISSLALFDGGMIDLIGVPAINLAASPLPPHALAKKELFDRVFAALALLALTPLLIAIALAVKVSSRGPVLFKQRRKGADGRVFRIYKFRTMRTHDEAAGVVTQATRSDARVTSLGRFLRRTSLDELPQFVNVLRGEMSVVGPRPHALEHDELYQKVVSGYIHRYRIKPGITGWAQVNGFRGETDRVEKMQGRVEHDLYYLRNWSFALDMRIVAATIARGFSDSNAF
ncbi:MULTISPECIES: undecaprenyl-phosphate glucose phosphotransferase [Paraburkholderia]|uniref:undecaprenyl-phosphate glucose phosphotransferase n=1 Tax=Paraburkholderia TaxID=1822464 RepID=UPI00224F15ED|nr:MULTISPECIES: undecaprenyl-phosphate glucose phosphotransferase [Paraburkholderia]MCX4161550.1 undecaprenyl-phosphate glucose phosphotransferase [Paraburkholderia megapolitana]MDN7157046.1 undecaprenyl-phosphate glucose phosphotransferase [Paraburkholderia sp. CHISQ3]MDQ6494091.1 undecaprenyl-phosphate glucose phosphotransferase [Paraburkholderia megapolitana]